MKSLTLPASRVNAILGEPLLTVAQVADHFGVHRSTIHRLAGRPNGIPCIRVGESLRFRPEDVRAYVDRQTLTGSYARPFQGHQPAMVAEGQSVDETASTGRATSSKERKQA